MTDHKFTDDQIIRCLNECDGKENVVAHIVDQGEDELVSLGRILEIINRQKAALRAKIPCDFCKYTPPSSCDGKPCVACPALPLERTDQI